MSYSTQSGLLSLHRNSTNDPLYLSLADWQYGIVRLLEVGLNTVYAHKRTQVLYS